MKPPRLAKLLARRVARSAASAALGFLVTAAIRRLTQFSFRDRAVLITGGSRGLGLVLARLLGGEGAKLMLVARDAGELGRAAEELRCRGIEVRTIVGDVADPETAAEAVGATVREFGRLDLLINNAGIIIVGPLENMTERDYEAALATHFWAPLRFMTTALPYLKDTRGRIVNICSIGGKIAVPHLAPYSASKFALAGLSDAFRAELARSHISVTSVFPGLMRTGSHLQALFKGRRDREFGWFALGSATPLTSISARRAARQIIEACRSRRPEVVVSIQARLAILANAVLPNLTAHAAAMINRLLPDSGSSAEPEPGAEVRGSFPPRLVTILPDDASRANNETTSIPNEV